MTAYRLLACDLITDQVMDVLPIQGLSFDDYIGKTGSLSGTIPVPDAAMAARVQGAIVSGRTMLWLERDQNIVWSGICWVDTPTRSERGLWSLPIQGAGTESYFRLHRQVTETQVFTGADQLDIARGLITYAQGKAGGNIGVEIDPTLMSGTTRTRTYLSYDLGYVGQLIDQLGATQGGFEWRINGYRDAAGARHKMLQLGYPTIQVGSTDTVLNSPGPITAYKLPRDATVQANAWTARGASVNTNQAATSYPLMSGPWTTPGDYAIGWPRLDGSADYSTTDVQADLDLRAQADLARQVRPVLIPQVRINLAATSLPQLGSTVRLRIRDLWYPNGYDARFRVVGYTVTPPERGRPETADLYLEAL